MGNSAARFKRIYARTIEDVEDGLIDSPKAPLEPRLGAKFQQGHSPCHTDIKHRSHTRVKMGVEVSSVD